MGANDFTPGDHFDARDLGLNAQRRPIDGPWARIIALLIAIGVSGILVYIHRHDLFQGDSVASAVSSGIPALDQCLEQRFGEIDTMVREGVISDSQAGTFKQRAEGFCIGQFGSPGTPNVRQ